MSELVKPDFCNWITACIIVDDIQKALDFYTQIFGFKAHFILNDTKTNRLVMARITYKGSNLCLYLHDTFDDVESNLGFTPKNSNTKTPLKMYFYCDDLDDRYQKAKENGLTILVPPTLQFWGDCVFRVLDPFGYLWEFATMVSERDSSRFEGKFL